MRKLVFLAALLAVSSQAFGIEGFPPDAACQSQSAGNLCVGISWSPHSNGLVMLKVHAYATTNYPCSGTWTCLDSLTIQEDTALHDAPVYNVIASTPEQHRCAEWYRGEPGFDECQIPWEYRVWGFLWPSNYYHNGTWRITAQATAWFQRSYGEYCPLDCRLEGVTAVIKTNSLPGIHNIHVTDTATPRILVWDPGKPNQKPTIPISFADAELPDTTHVTIDIYSTDNHSLLVQRIELDTPTSTSTEWDGSKIGGGFADRGLYVYTLRVEHQEKTWPCVYPHCDACNQWTERSVPTGGGSDSDERNSPLVVECTGVEEVPPGTEVPPLPPTGHVRFRLEYMIGAPGGDATGWALTSCGLRVYSPDLEVVASRDDLPRVIGSVQEVFVDVPVDSTEDYYFVVYAKDNGKGAKDHQPRPLLEHNARTPPTAWILLDGSASYLPEVGNTTTVHVKVMDRPDESGTLLTKARVPVQITATPSHLRGICTNYKIQIDPSEVYGTNMPKADMVWHSVSCKQGEVAMEPNRDAYDPAFARTIYSDLDPAKPIGAPTYVGGQFVTNLRAHDYGGRMLIAASPPTGGQWGHVAVITMRDPLKRAFVYVPEDFDGDRLPDSWESCYPALGFTLLPSPPDSGDHNDYERDNDPEPSTPASNVGDGYWAFEEYRGIYCKGAWRRLDPGKKELVIRTDLDTGNVAAATGFTVHEVDTAADTEISGHNDVAYNCPASSSGAEISLHVGQNGIWVKDMGAAIDPIDPNALGRSPWSTPNGQDAALDLCSKIYTGVLATRVAAWPPPATAAAVQTHVITHEVCHSIKLTPVGVVDYAGEPHHEPHIGCVMDRYTDQSTYPNNALCAGTCRPAMRLW